MMSARVARLSDEISLTLHGYGSPLEINGAV